VECLERAREFRITLCGNHDEAVAKSAFGFNEIAEQAVNWTREVLRPRWLSGYPKRRRWEFLQNLPLTHEEGDFLFVHGSPRNPTMEYVFESDVEDFLQGYSTKIEKIFREVRRYCFVGHTHTPGIFTDAYRFLSPEEISYRWRLNGKEKIIVNIGSVGQPRDRDNRAAYALLEGDTVLFRRVPYDYRATAEKIRRTRRLHLLNGQRLEEGE